MSVPAIVFPFRVEKFFVGLHRYYCVGDDGVDPGGYFHHKVFRLMFHNFFRDGIHQNDGKVALLLISLYPQPLDCVLGFSLAFARHPTCLPPAEKVEATTPHVKVGNTSTLCNSTLKVALTLGHFLDKFQLEQIFINRKPLCKTISRFL
jgi:hypothetical protein